MLKKIRQALAWISIILVTLLFVDFTGVAARWWGWMAKIQFLPAVLSLNFAVIAGLFQIQDSLKLVGEHHPCSG